VVHDGSPAGASAGLTARIAPPPSQEVWSDPSIVRGSGTNPASGLARTVSDSDEYAHVVFTGETVNGVPVSDDGPYRLISYTRSGSDGDNWRAPLRLNPRDRHGADPTIAASGSTVYVAWVQVRQADLDEAGPRVLFVRANRAHGSSAWDAPVRLTTTTGVVVGPRIAAAGRNVYVAYTDGRTGDVRVAVSNDRGRSWTTRTVGSTTRDVDGRRDAGVSVAGERGVALVSWISNGTGTVKVRGSFESGLRWADTRTIGSGADPGTATSAGVHDIGGALAWVDGGKLRWAWTNGRRVTGGSWTTGAIDVAYIPGGYLGFESVSVALRTDRQLGMSYQACRVTCDPADDAYRSDVFWQARSSSSPNRVIGESGSALRAMRPTVLWPSASLRLLVATVVDPDTGKERLDFRTGIGTP
jgi:hypothetical protein